MSLQLKNGLAKISVALTLNKSPTDIEILLFYKRHIFGKGGLRRTQNNNLVLAVTFVF